MKSLLTLLLLFVFYTFLPGQNIVVKSFRMAPNDVTARITAPVKDQNGTKQDVGEVWLYVPHKAHKLTIKHQQLGVLDSYLYPVPIKESTVYIMELTTGTVVTTFKSAVVPMQWLTLTSEVDGADVYLNNELVGLTPFARKLKTGKYNYRVEKYMYHSSVGVVTLTEDKKEQLNITLKPAFGFVKITTMPEDGARITIDNEPVNEVTPFTSIRLKSGRHSVTVKKVMFKTKTKEFEIVDNQTANLTINMQPNFATVTVEALPEVDIYIDDEFKGKGNFTGRVMPGIHTFAAKNEKYRTDEKQLEFALGEDMNIILHPIAITGSADIISKPFDATVKLDGKVVGTTPLTLNNLLIGEHKMIIEKDGYGTVYKNLTIAEDKTVEVDEVLLMGMKITISSNPSGVSLTIDGSYTDVTPCTKTLNYGNHTVKLINGKRVVEQTITIIQNGKTRWNIDVEMNKGVFTDPRDGVVYKWVSIGNQTWMAENLRYASGKYVKNDKEWVHLEDNNYDAAYCWYYNKNHLKQESGALYTYAAAIKACPVGWHLPTDAEWTTLENFIKNDGYSGKEGNALKAVSWKGKKREFDGIDIYGFTALPDGYRNNNDGLCMDMGFNGDWWSSTEYSDSYAYYRTLYYGSAYLGHNSYNMSYGFSVRCIRD